MSIPSRIKRNIIIPILTISIIPISITALADDAANELKADYTRPTTIPAPEDNPITNAKTELGKKLFFDPRLSQENNISCASCHNPSFAWEDGQATSVGTPMTRLGRHTPTTLNLAWGELYFWDGRAESLEEQALGPIQAAGEMAQELESLIIELEAIPAYVTEFNNVFPNEGLTASNIGKAIATYERTIVSATAPFDKWISGDESAISASAKKGFELFNGKSNCASCHSGWNFTDWGFYDIGIDDDDVGRYEILEIDALKHGFKTPGLRNIAERAPYMHNGSMKSLEEVIDHYNDGFVARTSLSEEIKPLQLTDQEKYDLISFLETLSSKDPATTLPILPNKNTQTGAP